MNLDGKTLFAVFEILGVCQRCEGCGAHVHVSEGKWQIAVNGGVLDYGTMNERSVQCRKEGEVRSNCIISKYDTSNDVPEAGVEPA